MYFVVVYVYLLGMFTYLLTYYCFTATLSLAN